MKSQSQSNLEDIVLRMAMEYIEMPDLKLTLEQAQRLWSLPASVCETALSTLVARRFLTQTPTGAFLRCGAQDVAPVAQAS